MPSRPVASPELILSSPTCKRCEPWCPLSLLCPALCRLLVILKWFLSNQHEINVVERSMCVAC